MKKIAFALTMALGLVAAQKASAATESYSIKGSSCTSITSGVIGQYDQYGVSPNGATAMNVTCPLIFPDKGYTQVDVHLYAYSRSTPDKVSCTISATDLGGSGLTTGTATVFGNEANSQFASTGIYPTGGNDELSLTCHIPGTTGSGPSYLSWIKLIVTY